MLNVKYLIVGADQVQLNPDANGNAWFVDKVKIVDSANEEIQALDSLNTKNEVVIEHRELYQVFNSDYKTSFEKDSTATIKLTKNVVTQLVYTSKTSKEQFAVFSEIYYKDGWNAYVDGGLAPHFRVNYVLRGMIIPEGRHTIEFKFEPTVIKTGSAISLVSYAFLLLIPLGWFFFEKKKQNKSS